MSDLKVLSLHNEATKVGKQAPSRTSSNTDALDVEGVDNLLVFWPDKLVDLNHLLPAATHTTANRSKSLTTLLVGRIVQGHEREAALLVIGTVAVHDSGAVFDKVTSSNLALVGLLAPSDASPADLVGLRLRLASLHDSPVWLMARVPSTAEQLPSIFSVVLSGDKEADDHVDTSMPYAGSLACAVNLICYTAPNSRMLQYFALESLRLAPVSGMKLISTASVLLAPDLQLAKFSGTRYENAATSALQNKLLQLLLLDPVHWRSLRCIQPHQDRMPRGTALRRCIEHINLLQAQHERFALSVPPSDHGRIANGSTSRQAHGLVSRFSSMAWLGRGVTSAALAAQKVLRRPLYTWSEHANLIEGIAQRPGSQHVQTFRLTLTSISACARQLDARISQLVVAPRLASRLRYLRKEQKLPIDEIAAPYIGLWNAMWLIANDIILGHAASVILLQNKSELAHVGRELAEKYLLDSVLWLLSWLDNWPAGLKLNTELSLFFSEAYSSLTGAWHMHGLVHVLSRLETVVAAMALAGRLMGVTMALCMVQDLVSICTLHITVFYTLSFRTLRAFLYLLSALFDVFRGKKRNALRGGRLDDADYELDQLLLGTLLFTLVAFLLPTVYVYYLAFGLIRLGSVAFEVGLVGTCLGLLNHVPLFALMLRFKDPRRLPAGVWLQDIGSTDASTSADMLKTGRFRLRSRPLAISDIFEGYGDHVGGLVEVPSMVLRCILGRPLRRSLSPSS